MGVCADRSPFLGGEGGVVGVSSVMGPGMVGEGGGGGFSVQAPHYPLDS